ncbi:MAG: uncharacterized protein QOE92_81 [Chloroflexota bacterium]|jgi:uncharacterized protein (DUF1684 family)|nr:uncharacterized protein [Chloroflexota bacterium]
MQEYLDLVDWRRRVGNLYRTTGDDALAAFRSGRDQLFATHPQSPLTEADRAAFRGLEYFPPDPAYRLACTLEQAGDESEIVIDTGGADGEIHYRRAGVVRFQLNGVDCALTVLSIVGYGGGLFLPFRDTTAPAETYGAGRYLFDTIKNTDGLALDLRVGSPEVVIDFNYAYNPSCAYNPAWACPLAPRENWIDVRVEAGEKKFTPAG